MENQPDQEHGAKIDANAIVDRFRHLLKCETDVALADVLSLPQSTISSWRRRNSVPLEIIIQISEQTKTSVDFIIFGRKEEADSEGGTKWFDADILRLSIAFAYAFNNMEADMSGKLSNDIVSFYAILTSRIANDQSMLKMTLDEAIAFESTWLEEFKRAKRGGPNETQDKSENSKG